MTTPFHPQLYSTLRAFTVSALVTGFASLFKNQLTGTFRANTGKAMLGSGHEGFE